MCNCNRVGERPSPLRPTDGTVEVEGHNIFSLKDDSLTIFRRRKIGFVFQSFNLVPVLNVYENIVLPIELDGNRIDTPHIEHISIGCPCAIAIE